jgi:hypothetical protein
MWQNKDTVCATALSSVLDQDPGYEIRDKHPGSATLALRKEKGKDKRQKTKEKSKREVNDRSYLYYFKGAHCTVCTLPPHIRKYGILSRKNIIPPLRPKH